MFWTISGFVFAFVYLNKQEKVTSKKFFVNRFARLYPLHFATLLIVTLFQTINYTSLGSFQIFQINDLFHFFLNLFFISAWGFESDYSFNGPIWSVSMELVIYVLFFISIINLNKHKIKFVLLVYFLLLIIDMSGFFDLKYTTTLFIECARLFYSGVLIFYICEVVKNKLYLIFLSFLLIFLSFVGNFEIFLFFPSMLLLFVGLEIFIHEKFKKTFVFFGNLTYAMYLLHIPTQLLIIFVFNYFGITNEIFLNNYFFILYFLTIITLSFLCFTFYEKPLSNKIRSRLS